jgi:hypothetical protein
MGPIILTPTLAMSPMGPTSRASTNRSLYFDEDENEDEEEEEEEEEVSLRHRHTGTTPIGIKRSPEGLKGGAKVRSLLK